MSVRLALRHRIEERFARHVRLSTHWLRLRPAPAVRARVCAYSLKVDAGPHFLNWVRDPFENHLARLDLPETVGRLGLDVELIAELEAVNAFDFLLEPFASNYPFEYPAQLRRELAPYLAYRRVGPRLSDWLRALNAEPAYIVEFLEQLNARVRDSVPATRPSRPGPVDLEALLEQREGSGWELAWLGVMTLRALGLAARFVAGYRVLLGGEPSASYHAWLEVFLPGAGWIGMDPAAGLFTNERYLPLAATPDPLQALPVVGYREACEEQRDEQVEVRRLEPQGRSGPLAPSQWEDLRAVGRRIDADLQASGVGLAALPSLSFVSAAEPETGRVGPMAAAPVEKEAALKLLVRLRDRLAPGAVLQASQGEWFAGETLPRWRLGCYARRDGLPVCQDPARIGWSRGADASTVADAERFGEMLTRALGLDRRWLVPAREDALYALGRRRASAEPMPSAEELCDPERRRMLAERLSGGATAPRGYVLPLRWDPVGAGWTSGVWRFRRGGVFLLPGESPMGYRLPLEGLPREVREAPEPEPSQFAERMELPESHPRVGARLAEPLPSHPGGVDGEVSARPPSTALCLDVREGLLHCFLPPLTHLEAYLELVSAVESVSRALGLSVALEGYEPPEDHRLHRLELAPDAGGVLRVHLPPTLDSSTLETRMAAVYEEAERVGLRAEHILLDGRRVPPGGGVPLCLGGPQPGQSPFLRRPQLVRSVISYWHRHPSLSYLFAGQGIGPSGPAPRVDEGRQESLYELNLALERLPAGEAPVPWLVDRALRHLLGGPTGNSRRTELRLDELYDPVRASRRLGRVTLGCFEMAPAPELAILQTQLVRALVARFLRTPESGPLTPWGSDLHDRFLLPRLLWEDFESVLKDLSKVGYPLPSEWFEPLLDRRFPVLGSVHLEDVELELRQAHEPWPLLAEEAAGGRMARFLDSANGRVQVRASGLMPGRYALECNGASLPLRPTGVVGEWVAGVRFKVWDPPATAHPTVPPVDSLVFDLIDTWNGAVVGGFAYYPARPTGWWTPGQASFVAAAPGPVRPERRVEPVSGVPVWSTGGRFVSGGSGRGQVESPPRPPGPARSFVLDLSFPV